MKLSNEVKIAIIVTAAIIALIWGINYLKGSDLFSRKTEALAVYDNVDGLVASNPVYLRGYRIGQVEKLKFLPDHSGRMLATLYLRKDVFLPRNSIAQIINDGLLGGKAVNIELGNDLNPIQDGDTLEAELMSGIAQQVGPIKDKAERLIESLDSVTNALHLLLNESTRRNLTKSIESLANVLTTFENTSRHLDYLVSSDQSKLNIMLSNATSISTNLKNNNEKLSKIIENFSQISDSLAKSSLASTMLNANKVISETSAIMQKINKGEGTLGLLVNNDSLYKNLSSTASDLDKLLIDLKANPKRYVHLSMFGGGKSK